MNVFPSTRQSPVFLSTEHPERLATYLSEHPRAQVVILDDAAYSGEQIARAVSNARSAAGEDQARVHVVVSDVTHVARSRLRGLATLHSSHEIPTIDQHLQRESPALREQLMSNLARIARAGYGDDIRELTLTLPSYKVPDGLSFPGFLAEGSILEPSREGRLQYARDRALPFILGVRPHYRQVPVRDPR